MGFIFMSNSSENIYLTYKVLLKYLIENNLIKILIWLYLGKKTIFVSIPIDRDRQGMDIFGNEFLRCNKKYWNKIKPGIRFE